MNYGKERERERERERDLRHLVEIKEERVKTQKKKKLRY
jgi:hypothetical protein